MFLFTHNPFYDYKKDFSQVNYDKLPTYFVPGDNQVV